jgi:DNA polymerase-3 subunit gamma/tau
MAYEVTATRKRPQLFDSLVGQEFVVSTIKNSIEQGRTAHAYLFSGPRGVGKTSSARILAKALNCEQGPTPYPCGVCSHCREITTGNSPDVIEIDGASNTSVNDVRVIKDEVLFPPQSCRYKVYIIDEVHMLSTSAFNALLKTIEEPPEYVVFIFATTETQKVPATIRSRCQQFHFQLIPLEMIKDVLVGTAREMDIEAEDEALFWIAKESTGSMRDAYTLFDQVVSFSGGNITMELISRKLGLAGLERITAILESLLADRTDRALLALHELLESGVSVEQCIKDLAGYVRTLLLIKRGISNESILGVQIERIPSTLRTAYSEEQLEAVFDLFLKLYRDIRFSLSPRFELELAVSRLSHLPHMVSSTTLVKRIEQLKDSLMTGEIRVAKLPRIAEKPKFETTKGESSVGNSEETKAVPTPKPEAKVVEPKGQPVVQRPKLERITMESLPELIQDMAAERDPAGIVLSQVVSVNHTDEAVEFVFASQYAMEHAKQKEETLRKLVARHTGYDGPIRFSRETIADNKPEVQKKKTDDVAQTIATLFRGEVLHLQ